MRSLSNTWNDLCLLFSVKNRKYKQNTHTHTKSGAENSLFQFWLTLTKPFSPFYLKETTNYWSLGAWWEERLFKNRIKRCDRLATRETTYVFLFSAKNRIYIIKTHTYTRSGDENSLFQFWLTITKTVFSVLSRGNEKLQKSCSFTRR